MRKENPNFLAKIEILEGDISLLKLGLSEKDRETLINEVDIMIHNAANVYFDIRVSDSLTINVLGTKEMLDLAAECKHMKAFVYVSTAYSHCYRKEIREECYDPPANMKMIKDIMEADRQRKDGLTQEALDMLLGEWPNIYCFSKSVAEDLVNQYAQKLKCACIIFRPSIGRYLGFVYSFKFTNILLINNHCV